MSAPRHGGGARDNFEEAETSNKRAYIKIAKPSISLPIEIIRMIAMQIARLGTRSAVTAALIHPSFTKEALESTFTVGTIIKVDTPNDFAAWLYVCDSAMKLGRPIPPVHTIRLTGTEDDEWSPRICSSLWKQMERYRPNSVFRKDHSSGLTLEIYGKTKSNAVSALTRMFSCFGSLTVVCPQSASALPAWSEFDSLEEVTIVDLEDEVFPLSLRYCKNIKQVYVFYREKGDLFPSHNVVQDNAYIKWGKSIETNTWLTARLLSACPEATFNFISIDKIEDYITQDKEDINTHDNKDTVTINESTRLEERLIFLRYFDNVEWHEKDLNRLFQIVNRAKDAIKGHLMRAANEEN